MQCCHEYAVSNLKLIIKCIIHYILIIKRLDIKMENIFEKKIRRHENYQNSIQHEQSL